MESFGEIAPQEVAEIPAVEATAEFVNSLEGQPQAPPEQQYEQPYEGQQFDQQGSGEQPATSADGEAAAEDSAAPTVNYSERIAELEHQVSVLQQEISRLREEQRRAEGSKDSKSVPKSLVSVGDAAIFVSDIARGVDEEQLKEAFSKLAPAIECHIIKSKRTGLSKGFGFVKFNSMDDVYKVLDKQAEWPSFEDRVSHRRTQVRVQIADPKNVLYIVGLPRDFTYDQAAAEVSQHGKVDFTKFDLATDSEGRSRGFGWISYKDHEAALVALRNLQSAVIRGTAMRDKVSMAEPRVVDHRAILRSKGLFVKGLKAHVTKEMLEALFNDGKELVEKVTIPLDQMKHVPLGHAFVTFKERPDAAAAMDRLHGTDYEGRKLQIEWCIPQDAKSSKKRGFDDHRGPPPRSTGFSGPHGGDRGYGGSDRYHDRGSDRYSDRYNDRYDDRYRDEPPSRRPRYDDRPSSRGYGGYDEPRGPPRGGRDYYDDRAQPPPQQAPPPAQYGAAPAAGSTPFQELFSANVGNARDALFSLASSLSRGFATAPAAAAPAAQPAAGGYYGGAAAQPAYGASGVQYPSAGQSGYSQAAPYSGQQQYGATPTAQGSQYAQPSAYGAAGGASGQYGASAAPAAGGYGSSQYNPYSR